jgi:predicted XRE-type DNA-binding protein
MKKDYTVGSGNVFADLGLPNAEEHLAKARLAIQIGKFISKKKLTQAAAAKLLGVDQPRVSKLLRGRLSEFSTDTLVKFINALGSDVDLVVRERPRSRGRGHFQVRWA